MKLKLPVHELEIDKDDKDFISKIAGNDLVSLLGGDWIRYWRWKNLTSIVKKIKTICDENKLDPQVVAPKFLSEFFQQASLEDDESIQDMWAHLLKNKSIGKEVNFHFIRVLKELESKEAVILNLLYQNIPGKDVPFDSDKVAAVNGLTNEQMEVIIEKLYSFRLLKPAKLTAISTGGESPPLDTTKVFVFTSIGISFCRAVSE